MIFINYLDYPIMKVQSSHTNNGADHHRAAGAKL